jgi:hypothetical protein
MVAALVRWFFWAYNKLYYDKLFPAPVMEGQGWRRVFGSC